MDLYPAVDIRGGRVAHVRTGNAFAASVYGADPVAAVRRLATEGAHWVHVVDLDRAYGTGSNRDLTQEVLVGAPLQVQVGGSLRTEEAIDELLGWGAARVVIGCAGAANDPSMVGRLVRRHGNDRLAVAIEATDGRVTPRGAVAAPPLPVLDLARIVRDHGARTLIYTDVSRDGTLAGPDVAGAQALSQVGLAVVAGGGVGTLSDLAALKSAGLAGAIVGRALHEGRFALSEALACVAG